MARGRNKRLAQAETDLRFGPQETALDELIGQTVRDYGKERRAIRNEARFTVRGVKRAVAPTKQLYTEATETANQAAADVSAALGALGPGADAFKAMTAREQGGALTQIGEAKARSLTGLKERKQLARQGRQSGLYEARQGYKENMTKLGDRLLALGDQRGAYEAGRLSELSAAAAQRRFEKRQDAAERQHDFDIETHKDTLDDDDKDKDGKGKDGKDKGVTASPEQTTNTQKLLAEALDRAKGELKAGTSLQDAINALQQDVPAVERRPRWKIDDEGKRVPVLKHGDSGPQKLTPGMPALEGIDDPIIVQAALQQIYNGYITTPIRKKLAKRGFKPKDLGLVGPGAYGRQHPDKAGPF